MTRTFQVRIELSKVTILSNLVMSFISLEEIKKTKIDTYFQDLNRLNTQY